MLGVEDQALVLLCSVHCADDVQFLKSLLRLVYADQRGEVLAAKSGLEAVLRTVPGEESSVLHEKEQS
jgi:hypothetical protein